MENLIQQERDGMKRYMIDTCMYENKALVVLSFENVCKIEAMIKNDSKYGKASDKSAGPRGSYLGSTAYWFNQMKPLLDDLSIPSDDEKWEEVVKEVVCSIDRENSTHLNADGVGRDEITKRIVSNKDDLIEMLKDKDNLELFNLIQKETNPEDNKHHSRINTSFASKFCHYACLYLFEGQPEQDNYSIYDNVIREVLPLYASKYGVMVGNLKDYVEYSRVIDAIRSTVSKETGYELSRNGFDHLLWYFHKGQN